MAKITAPLSDEQRKIAEENHKLVYSVAHKFRGLLGNQELDELIGYLNLCYLERLRKFDSSKALFSTYIVTYLQYDVLRFLENQQKRDRIATFTNEPAMEDLEISDPLDIEHDTVFRDTLYNLQGHLTGTDLLILKILLDSTRCSESYRERWAIETLRSRFFVTNDQEALQMMRSVRLKAQAVYGE